MFDEGTKVCMAIGGWGDTAGFGVGSASEQSRKTYAANVAAAMERLGYDCVGEFIHKQFTSLCLREKTE